MAITIVLHDNSATQGVDYDAVPTGTSFTVPFAQGETTKVVTDKFAILADADTPAFENFLMEIASCPCIAPACVPMSVVNIFEAPVQNKPA